MIEVATPGDILITNVNAARRKCERRETQM